MRLTESKLRSIIKSVIRENLNFGNAGLELAKTERTNIKLMSYVLKVSLDNPEHSLTKKRIDYREQANKLCSFVEKIGGEIKETGTDSFEFLITMPAVLGEPEDIVQKIIQKMNTNIG